jgi:hypothetical protein
MSGAYSRSKGARGEREAAEALTVATGIPWRRTAQRWGKAKADIEPCDGGVGIHVEVKRYDTGLAWWVGRVEKRLDCVHVDADGALYFCALDALSTVMAQQGDIEEAPNQPCVARWMRQAVSDAEDGLIPVVLCRQDRGPWLLAWRYADDDHLMAIFRGLRK